jgi:hypothetical protein
MNFGTQEWLATRYEFEAFADRWCDSTDPFSWHSTDLVRRRDLPDSCGIYAITAEAMVVYIGSSHDIHSRLKSHAKIKQFPAGSVVRWVDEGTILGASGLRHDHLSSPYAWYRSLEERLIRRWNPPLNSVFTPRAIRRRRVER